MTEMELAVNALNGFMNAHPIPREHADGFELIGRMLRARATPPAPKLLTQRRDRVLNGLRLLSEARASRAAERVRPARQPSGSGPPIGVSLDRLRSQRECPDRERSLFDFYAWQFQRAPITDYVKLCFLAERDLEARQRTGEPTSERHRARNRSILHSRYTDQPPAVVAAVEDCTEKHVRTWRKANGLNALTGRHER